MEDRQRIAGRNARINEQSAIIRHRLGNLQSSLRILEGGYLNGWIRRDEVAKALEAMRLQKISDPASLENLGSLADLIPKLTPFVSREDVLLGEREVWICDDDWPIWDAVLTPLFQRALGVKVRGFATRDQLKQNLSPQASLKIVTLLHDVHFEEKLSLRPQDIKTFQEERPLLDITLFTSDIEDGELVREAAEAGYRIFFKELDVEVGAARDTAAYASKLVEVVNASLEATTARALYHLAKIGFPDLEHVRSNAGREAKELLKYLEFYIDNPLRPVVLMIVPLLEKQFVRFYREVVRQPIPSKPGSKGNKEINWPEATSQILALLTSRPYTKELTELRERAFREWIEVYSVAKGVRNEVLHNPVEQVTSPIQSLPLIGLMLPVVATMSALYRLEIALDENPAVDPFNHQKRLLAMQQLSHAVISSPSLPVTLRSILRDLSVGGMATTPPERLKLIYSWIENHLKTARISKDLSVSKLRPRFIRYVPINKTMPISFGADLTEVLHLQEIASICLLSSKSARELGIPPDFNI